MHTKADVLVWTSIAFSLVFFVAALRLPALQFQNDPAVTGMTTLLFGWWGFLSFDFPWLANPIYLAALIFALVGKWQVAQILVWIALGFGALSIFVHTWYFDESHGTPVIRLGSAFYVWMASFCVLLLGISFARVISGPPPSRPPVAQSR